MGKVWKAVQALPEQGRLLRRQSKGFSRRKPLFSCFKAYCQPRYDEYLVPRGGQIPSLGHWCSWIVCFTHGSINRKNAFHGYFPTFYW